MDDEEFFLCVDCKRELAWDETVSLVAHDDGVLPLCVRCERRRKARARAIEALDRGFT